MIYRSPESLMEFILQAVKSGQQDNLSVVTWYEMIVFI